MGVRGLTTLIRSIGLIPKSEETAPENEELHPQVKSSPEKLSNRKIIPPGSTFAIDGPGLIFYIYRLAYHEHYKDMLDLYHQQGDIADDNSNEIQDLLQGKSFDGQHQHRHNSSTYFENEMHLINNLIPSFLPLNKIKEMTEKILTAFVHQHDLNLHIYLDGDSSRMKIGTRKDREARIVNEMFNLRNFFQSNILPACFKKGACKSSSKTSRPALQIPPAEAFLKEFPIPVLLFDEVEHVMRTFPQNHSSNSSSLRVVQIIQCEEEADRFVALQSAMDLNNTTYAVGSDSDYMVYGFQASIRQTMSIIGDPSVLYVPLDYLRWDLANELKAVVVTRSEVATVLGIEEDMLLEASIMMGNDYTSPFLKDSKLRKTTNFYVDAGSPAGTLNIVDTFLNLSSFGESYEIQSEHELFQLSIEFTRDIYQFQRIDHYPLDIDIDSDGTGEQEKLIDDFENDIDRILEITKCDFSQSKSAVKAMDETDTSRETLSSQVLASFLSFDQDIYDMLCCTLQVKSSPATDKGTLLSLEIEWKTILIAISFEKALSLTLLERRHRGIEGHPASDLFHYSALFSLLYEADKNRYKSESKKDEHDDMDNNKENKAILNKTPVQLSKDKTVSRRELPIDAHKSEILHSIRNNRVTIIQGETGSGKSSRVPVFCLEESDAKIVVCQPRRIAAKSLADRIRATELHLKDKVALRMGHGIREYENKKTRAWFMTTGYLVRYIANRASFFNDISYIIIDEVHERSADSDLLCLLARRLLQRHSSIRLILMSATVAAETYIDYFDVQQPPIFVGGRSFSIKEHYLEDFEKKLNLSSRETKIIRKVREKCIKMKCTQSPGVHYLETLQNLAVQVALSVAKENSSVLIFVPGMADIVAIIENIENIVRPGIKYKCIAIHGDIPFEEQMAAFHTLGKGEIKIIVATNAAESSLTLPDVDHVICTGLCKEIVYDIKNHRQILKCNWISKASATQRKGRTGRVREGNVYRLYTRSMYENDMSPYEIGEMHRMPLDSVILNLRSIVKKENVSDLLAECLEPPDVTTVQKSIASLHASSFIDDISDDFEITELGDLVNNLGIDLKFGALIGLGKKLNVLPESIAIAAVLSFPQSPWRIPNSLLQSQKEFNSIASETYISKSAFDTGLFSEPLAVVNLLLKYIKRCEKQSWAFCKRYSLSNVRMRRLCSTYDNLKNKVASALGCSASSLNMKASPDDFDTIKLNKLRLLQVWVFHDTIVKLNPKVLKKKKKNINVDGDGTISILVSGDELEEKHLKSILNKQIHRYDIQKEYENMYSGFWMPSCINHDESIGEILLTQSVEENILSTAVERNYRLICIEKLDETAVFVSHNFEEKIRSEFDSLSFTDRLPSIICSPNKYIHLKRGRKSIDCKKWVFKECATGDSVPSGDDGNIVFSKFTYSRSKKAALAIGTILKNLRSIGVQSFCLRCRKGKNRYPFDVFLYGGSCSFTKQDAVDIFETLNDNVEVNLISSHTKQFLKFHLDERTNKVWNPCIPEALRIVCAVIFSKRTRSQPLLRVEVESERDEEVYAEFSMQIPSIQGRWVQFIDSNSTVFVDALNHAASFSPLFYLPEKPLFACCASTLHLQNGAIKAEGLTILPPGEEFLYLAFKCIGIKCPGIDLIDFPGKEQKEQLAEIFNSLFWSDFGDLHHRKENLNILSMIFTSESNNAELDPLPDKIDLEPNILIDDAINVNSLLVAEKVSVQQTNDSQTKGNRYFCIECKQTNFKWSKLLNHMKKLHKGKKFEKKVQGKKSKYHMSKYDKYALAV